MTPLPAPQQPNLAANGVIGLSLALSHDHEGALFLQFQWAAVRNVPWDWQSQKCSAV